MGTCEDKKIGGNAEAAAGEAGCVFCVKAWQEGCQAMA